MYATSPGRPWRQVESGTNIIMARDGKASMNVIMARKGMEKRPRSAERQSTDKAQEEAGKVHAVTRTLRRLPSGVKPQLVLI